MQLFCILSVFNGKVKVAMKIFRSKTVRTINTVKLNPAASSFDSLRFLLIVRLVIVRELFYSARHAGYSP